MRACVDFDLLWLRVFVICVCNVCNAEPLLSLPPKNKMQQGPASAEVAAHERVRGFQYGGELLPVDQAAEAALRWQEEEVAMRLITFLPRSKAKRWHALANALAIRPHHKDGTRRAAVLLASLAQALRDTDSVALVR